MSAASGTIDATSPPMPRINATRRHAHPKSRRARYLRQLGYLPVYEVANLVGVNRITVYRHLQNGSLTGLDDHGAYYVHWRSARRAFGSLQVSDPPNYKELAGALPEGAVQIGPPPAWLTTSSAAELTTDARPPSGPITVALLPQEPERS